MAENEENSASSERPRKDKDNDIQENVLLSSSFIDSK